MKQIRLMSVILLVCIIMGACGAGGQTAHTGVQKENSAAVKKTDVSIAQSWWNIHDGDVYHLNADGSGSHNEISLTYTMDADVLSVTEGVASLQTRRFRLDSAGTYIRLIPEGETSFYVTEDVYKELAPKVRRESIQILMSYESWKASTIDGYLFFNENGTGSLKYPASNINQEITWEMVDNDTLRAYLPVDSTKQGVNTMDIVNDNGKYSLMTDDPAVYYTPHGDIRPKTAAAGSIVAIDAGYGYTLCLKEDGTAVAVGNNELGQCAVSKWKDLKAVSGSNMHTVGLQTNGKLISVGDNSEGQRNVEKWTDIAQIEASYFHTVALRTDGTAVGTGYNKNGQCDLKNWKDISAISAGGYHTLGLKSDGTVLAAGFSDDGRCDVQQWQDIVAVSGGGYHSVGLKADGTVVATGMNDDGQCDVGAWTDIIAISAGERHTVGLKSDGTVVAVGRNTDNQCRVGAWCDIVAISAGGRHTVGMKEDRSVVIIGNNDYGQCDAETLMKDG